MKKTIFICILAALLSLPSCAPAGEEARLTVVCTTYPVYLFASAITEGVDGVAVERLDTGSTSCLHDYTLSMEDMKKLERADVIALNGAGLEEFLEDALATSDAAVIDCSVGVELLENLSHHQTRTRRTMTATTTATGTPTTGWTRKTSALWWPIWRTGWHKTTRTTPPCMKKTPGGLA